MSYSSSFKDGMIQLGDLWIRASQIETVKRGEGHTTDNEAVIVRLISGRTVSVFGAKGEAEKVARMAVGL